MVDRRKAAGLDIRMPGKPGVLPSDDLVRMLDDLGVPDGMPFLIDDGGALASCAHVNAYLLAAVRQGGLDLGQIARFHSYSLARALRFVRLNRATTMAAEKGTPVDDWIADHGLPMVDLTAATRDDLVAYKAARTQEVKAATWNNDLSSLSGFFDYAVRTGWIDRNPIPRWGSQRRNTLAVKHHTVFEVLGTYDQLAHAKHVFATTPEAIEHAKKHLLRSQPSHHD